MSCSIIHLVMFAFTVSVNVIFPVASVSLPRVSEWPEKTAVIQVIVLVQANHLWVKYLFFRMWCSVGLCLEVGSVQVYNRFTRDFWGYCARVFFLKTHKVKILLIIPDHFFVPLQKNLLLSIIPLSEVHWLVVQA